MLAAAGGGQADAANTQEHRGGRMKIKVTKVERIEATMIHPDPNAPDGAA
jgi:hypothetical protein